MKIVIDARILRTSTGRYVERLLHYLQLIDSRNSYIVLLLKKDYASWTPSNKNFTKQMADYPLYSKRAQLSLTRQLNRLHADLVHFPFQMVPVLYRRPYVVTIHDLTQLRFQNPGKTKTLIGYSLKQKQLALNIKWALRNAKIVIAPSKYVKSDLVHFAPKVSKSKVFVTYEGVDIDSTNALPPSPINNLTNRDFILYVGTAHAHKNLELLLRAFAIVKKRHPALQLVLAGNQDAIYKKFIEEVRSITPADTHFLGYVSDAGLAWLYEKAKLYVFPSLSEGFGLPGLEAMSKGLPVVSSSATCLPEIYGDAAAYFDPQNPQQAAHIIDRVLTDIPLRSELIKKGHAQAKHYSWQKMAEQTLKLYEDSAS